VQQTLAWRSASAQRYCCPYATKLRSSTRFAHELEESDILVRFVAQVGQTRRLSA
jgi:hypothetical protein